MFLSVDRYREDYFNYKHYEKQNEQFTTQSQFPIVCGKAIFDWAFTLKSPAQRISTLAAGWIPESPTRCTLPIQKENWLTGTLIDCQHSKKNKCPSCLPLQWQWNASARRRHSCAPAAWLGSSSEAFMLWCWSFPSCQTCVLVAKYRLGAEVCVLPSPAVSSVPLIAPLSLSSNEERERVHWLTVPPSTDIKGIKSCPFHYRFSPSCKGAEMSSFCRLYF